jgi:hypothetical protein
VENGLGFVVRFGRRLPQLSLLALLYGDPLICLSLKSKANERRKEIYLQSNVVRFIVNGCRPLFGIVVLKSGSFRGITNLLTCMSTEMGPIEEYGA